MISTLRTLAALAVLLATGCGITQPSAPVSFYVLEAPELGPENAEGAGPVVIVESVALPAYLQRSQFVRRHGDHKLEVDEFHRWAEPLESGVQRTVLALLRQALPDTEVLRRNRPDLPDGSARIGLNLDRFEIADGTTAVLDGSARLRLLADGQWGTALNIPLRIRVPVEAPGGDGMEPMTAESREAAALSRALHRATASLVQHLRP